MSLSRVTIVDQLKEVVGADRVITDEMASRKDSINHFRKLPDIRGIYTSSIPAAVVKLGSAEQVSRVLNFMNMHKINGVPHTGASVTEGGLKTVVENSVVLGGSAMNQVISIDTENMQVMAQCGVPLEVLENALRGKGCTTGHSPQSKPLVRMGGLVVACSTGQFSTLYGVIRDMVAGLEAVLAGGIVTRTKNVLRRATDPGIRYIIVSNEGTLCYITEIAVKTFKFAPENNLLYGYILEGMEIGFNTLREIMAGGYHPSIVRLYDAKDDAQYFTHFINGKCVSIFMAEGSSHTAKATGEGIAEIIARYPQCQYVDGKLIETWLNNLNWGPDKVVAEHVQILKTGNMSFTTEVSGCWNYIHEIYGSVTNRIRTEFPYVNDITTLGGHSFHSYQSGANIYFTYDYNVVDCKPEEKIGKYHSPLNKVIYKGTTRLGGSMVHHHGIGKHRAHWSKLEHGSVWALLGGLKKQFDSSGIANMGIIYPIER